MEKKGGRLPGREVGRKRWQKGQEGEQRRAGRVRKANRCGQILLPKSLRDLIYLTDVGNYALPDLIFVII